MTKAEETVVQVRMADYSSDEDEEQSNHDIDEEEFIYESTSWSSPMTDNTNADNIYTNHLQYLCGGKFRSKPIFLNNGQLFAIAQSSNVKVYSAITGQFVANLPHENVFTVVAHPDHMKQVCAVRVAWYTHCYNISPFHSISLN